MRGSGWRVLTCRRSRLSYCFNSQGTAVINYGLLIGGKMTTNGCLSLENHGVIKNKTSQSRKHWLLILLKWMFNYQLMFCADTCLRSFVNIILKRISVYEIHVHAVKDRLYWYNVGALYLWFVVTERRPLFDDVYQPHVMYTFQIKIYWKVTSLFSFEKTIYFIFEKTLYCFDLSDGYFKVRFLQPMYLSGNAEKSKWMFSYILNSLFLKTRPRDNVSYDMDLDVLCLLFI